MNIQKSFFILPYTLTFILLFIAPAEPFQVEIFPSRVNPGDAFVIKVIDVRSEQLSEAVLNKNTFKFSRCGEGCFIAIGAVGIDTKQGDYPIKLNIGGNKAGSILTVQHKEFPTINLTLPEDKVILKPDDLKRAQKEAEKLKSIWPKESEKLWAGRFLMPLANKTSTQFGTKRIMNKKKISVHRGVDVKGGKGEPVKAFNKGKVVLAEELFFGGKTIILDHGQGIFSIYMHMSGFNAEPMDIVSKGKVIGFVGSSGRATGPHLHFGVKVQSINVNPVSLIELEL